MNKLTVGIIIIGDELLKGVQVEGNSYYLCKQLYSLGIKVKKISVIADTVEDISAEVKSFSERYSYVITTGGVGVTHDDVTYEGVAKALGRNLSLNEKMVNYYKNYCGGVTSDIDANPQLRISCVPENSEVIFVPTSDDELFKNWRNYPIVKVSNVFILPGPPRLTRLCFNEISKLYFQNNTTKFFNRTIYVKSNEIAILPSLNQAVKKFEGDVTFGSYPVMDNPTYQTKLIIESNKEDKVCSAETFLKKIIKSGELIDPIVAMAADNLYYLIEEVGNTDTRFKETIQRTVKVVEEAFTRYKSENVFVNFNGGKDCTVLLHLVTAVFQRMSSGNPPFNVVYFRSEDPFCEIESFIKDTAERYKIQVKAVPGPIKSGLATILAENPDWKAGFLGTRRTDPFSENLVHFQMTDEGWPKIMRINPLLDWEYGDIWQYLRMLNIPYCSLYDQGYTSLGNKDNTKPNPLLRFTDENGEIKYYPAYRLSEGSAEREGRKT